jgi:hypothetical protein
MVWVESEKLSVSGKLPKKALLTNIFSSDYYFIAI